MDFCFLMLSLTTDFKYGWGMLLTVVTNFSTSSSTEITPSWVTCSFKYSHNSAIYYQPVTPVHNFNFFPPALPSGAGEGGSGSGSSIGGGSSIVSGSGVARLASDNPSSDFVSASVILCSDPATVPSSRVSTLSPSSLSPSSPSP